MKVALVYDRVNKWGGAERVLLSLHKMFPDAPLFTSVYNQSTAFWAKVFPVVTSFLQYLPFAKQSHEYFPYFMPIAFESFTFDEYDVVISVTSEAAKGIITKPKTKHICLCLTPTRYLWSGYTHYFKNSLLRFFAMPVVAYLRFWDTIASNRPDTYVAISQEVQKRIHKYYHKTSSVIYPPINEKILQKGKAFLTQPNHTGEYFLIVSRISRFTSYKRIDLAIKAANKLTIPLKIVGEGDSTYLRSIAGPSVEFVGNVSDEELYRYYQNCTALLFAGIEDFGLSMVEAQAMGKPVVAFFGGGAAEIIQEGITGEFFREQTVESLVAILKNFHPQRYNKRTCWQNAARFRQELFEKQILSLIQQ